jgi:glycosyltransferase involved in cell wall biosynthesis
LLPGLQAKGVQVRVLFLLQGQQMGAFPTLSRLQQLGIPCTYTLNSPYTEQRVRWILEQLHNDPPDVFVPNLMVPAYYAARWAKAAGIPTIGILHSDDPFHWGLVSEFARGLEVYRLSAIVCVSRFLGDSLQQQRLPNTQIWHVPYIVPIPECAAAPAERFGLVYSGRLVNRQKRIIELARAFCRAAREVPGVTGLLYGDGTDRPEVEAILRTVGADVPVHLAGRIDNTLILAAMCEAHALVLLSDYEGLPIALLEGMACGLVPVCLRIRSGIPELVEDGVTGLLVDDRDDSFVAAIRRLREEPGLWERLSKAARARVEQEFSIQVVADRWLDLFQELLQQAPPRQTISVPERIILPPVHPDLAREDHRRPPLYQVPVLKLKALGRQVRRFAWHYAVNHSERSG